MAEALQVQITRVRDEVMPSYILIGGPGEFALGMMRRDMDAAVKALAEQDAVECLRLFEELRGYST